MFFLQWILALSSKSNIDGEMIFVVRIVI